MKGLICAVVACVGLLWAPQVANAAEGDDRLVKYVPVKQSIYMQSRKYVVRNHRLVVVPLYKAQVPDEIATRKMVDEAKAFWEREIPGLTISPRILAPVRLAAACDRVVNKAWSASAKAARINPRIIGNHLLAYAPECNMSGLGDLAPGYGQMYIGMPDETGKMLAHEFGHNLGLMHSNDVTCRTPGGEAISLSRKCTEREYANWSSVMGSGPLSPSVRSGPIAQVALTKRVTTIPSRGSTTITLSTGPTGLQSAMVMSQIGTLLVTARTTDETWYSRKSEIARVEVEVLTKEGSGRLNFPEVAFRTNSNQPALELGDTRNIPGSTLQMTVTATGATAATVQFTNRTTPVEPPAKPVVTANSAEKASFSVSWNTSDPDVVAFVVTAGERIFARVPGTSRSAILDLRELMDAQWEGADTSTFRVAALGKGGRTAQSEPFAFTEATQEVSDDAE